MSSAERREQLVEAAMRVAKRDGVGAVSTRAVAAEAQATPGIVHYVFASMSDLLRAMIQTIADQQVAAVQNTSIRGSDLRDSLVQSFETMWAGVEADPEAHQLTFEMTQYALREPRLAELARWQYDCYFEVARTVFETVSQEAEVDWSLPTETLARWLVATNDGVVSAWLADRDTGQARAVYRAFIDHICTLAVPRAG